MVPNKAATVAIWLCSFGYGYLETSSQKGSRGVLKSLISRPVNDHVATLIKDGKLYNNFLNQNVNIPLT